MLVDNFEDGNYTSLWNSPWGIYNDNKDGGQSTIDTSLVAGNSSSKAIQISYTLTKANYEYSPFVGLVVAANADTVTTEDLSACTAIQYDYKGGAHDFRVEPNQKDINVEYNYHKIAVNASKVFGKILRKIQQEARFGMTSVTHAITTVTTAQYEELVAIKRELEDRGFKVEDSYNTEEHLGQPYFCGDHRLHITWK